MIMPWKNSQEKIGMRFEQNPCPGISFPDLSSDLLKIIFSECNITVFSDRVEFLNPGNFYAPINPENLKEGFSSYPELCNPSHLYFFQQRRNWKLLHRLISLA